MPFPRSPFVWALAAESALAACGAAHTVATPLATTAPSRLKAHAGPTPEAATLAAETPSTPESRGLPALDVPWAGEGPITVAAAAPDRRWVAVCQAARDTTGDGHLAVSVSPQGELSGDALEGFLLEAAGAGERIDAFVGSDPSGRFVAVVLGGKLVLRDTTTRVDVDLGALGADVRDDRSSFVHPRAGAFDGAGQRFLYLRRDAQGSRVVVRDLATGGETLILPPAGELYRAEFDASSEWVILHVVTTDTDGNGRLEWPAPEAPRPFMRCTAPTPRYSVWERPRDEPASFVARAAGGPALEAPGLVTPLGDVLVLRDQDGALVRAGLGGARAPMVRKGCAAHLLHADAARGIALVTCADKLGRSDALLVGPAGTKPLGLALSAAAGDHTLPDTPRLVPLHPGSDAVLVDLDHGEIERLSPGDRILATVGRRALVLRGRALVLHELGAKDPAPLGEVDPLGHVLRAGSTLLVPPFIVDLASGTLLGTTTARALALSTDGSVLVAEGRSADATHLALGPLRWTRPDPPPPGEPSGPTSTAK